MSNSTNNIISQISNLDKEFEKANKKNDTNTMFKVLYFMRVLHGDILLSINNYKINDSDIKKRYRLSLLKSILDPIEECIKNAETILRNQHKSSKLTDIATYIDNFSEDIDNSLTLEDLTYNDESNIVSESVPDIPTEDILNKKDNKDNFELCKHHFDINRSDNLIVLFYAPWCGWSKKFLPIWDEFVEKMKNTKGLQCIKIDSDEKPDCIEHFGIEGFPTIKLLKKNNETIEFKDHRSIDNLIKWINHNIKF
jgi:thiol-disulfide isomerase/thioredoxin